MVPGILISVVAACYATVRVLLPGETVALVASAIPGPPECRVPGLIAVLFELPTPFDHSGTCRTRTGLLAAFAAGPMPHGHHVPCVIVSVQAESLERPPALAGARTPQAHALPIARRLTSHHIGGLGPTARTSLAPHRRCQSSLRVLLALTIIGAPPDGQEDQVLALNLWPLALGIDVVDPTVVLPDDAVG